MSKSNPSVHAWLIELGYEHTKIPTDWEEIGDAENGPKLSGYPGWDEYAEKNPAPHSTLIIIDWLGCVTIETWSKMNIERDYPPWMYNGQDEF